MAERSGCCGCKTRWPRRRIRAKARETLRLTDVLLDRVVAGALDLSGQQWRRLREALA